MAKFNTSGTRTAVSGPVRTETAASGRTFEGAPGYARDAKSELFLLAVANMVGEDTFYEKGKDRDARFRDLVHQVAVADPDWTVRFAGWLRGDGNMRSASLVAAAEAVKARLDARLPSVPAYEVPGHSTDRGVERALVDVVCQRADEPGEFLAYWMGRYGRKLPKPVKRGVADAARRLYTEFTLLKYDTASHAVRFADVLDLCHPSPSTPEQGALFKYALDRRHGRDDPGETTLLMVQANAAFRAAAARGEYDVLLYPDHLKMAGMTWEDVLSLAGSKVDKRKLWEALIPTMGYMAQLRNLRNFDEAGVSDEVAGKLAARLADPEQVARSRQFPFRFLAAYRNAPSLRWAYALDKALTASLANVPELKGRTLVLVDRSDSMFGTVSAKSQLNKADSAAVFGAALALRNVGAVDLVEFGSGSKPIPVKAGDSLLKTVERFTNLGGTETYAAVKLHFKGHDRVVIVTDEQAWQGYGDPGSAIPAATPLYTWNLAGYRYGHNAGDPHRHTFGGLTDAAFRLIPLLEAGRDADWPF